MQERDEGDEDVGGQRHGPIVVGRTAAPRTRRADTDTADRPDPPAAPGVRGARPTAASCPRPPGDGFLPFERP
ncbi:hypothetical protein SNE510_46980 [Streptomyces sp. NE5-10]|nr:hypothetical protein SNE510_46980 [Streptomyces sp. NE5-10]